jgi:glycosyltransferase involved in cell wall biosynthesis
MPSVVIPAHNEANVIQRCLESLLSQIRPDDLDIVVVCNGCSDDTADIARAFGGIRVLQTPIASKSHALNMGDQAVSSFPRLYLDADVELENGAVSALFAGLEGETHAVSPAPRFQLKRSSLLVRMFYRAWRSTPFYNRSMIGGSGAYALTASGRSRFKAFPDIISDDGFVRLQFRSDERRVVDGAVSVVHCPRDMKSLLRMMTRVDAGSFELRRLQYEGLQENEETSAGQRIASVAGRPWLLPCFVVYATTRFITRRRAARLFGRGGRAEWARDDSSRLESGDANA